MEDDTSSSVVNWLLAAYRLSPPASHNHSLQSHQTAKRPASLINYTVVSVLLHHPLRKHLHHKSISMLPLITGKPLAERWLLPLWRRLPLQTTQLPILESYVAWYSTIFVPPHIKDGKENLFVIISLDKPSHRIFLQLSSSPFLSIILL